MSNHHMHRRRSDGVVIAGGGLAAQRCTETLRRGGHDGPIRILCAEPHRPYDRPPLSKQLLAGAGEPVALAYRESDWYAAHGVDLLCGVAASSLSPAEHSLEASDGSILRYSKLLIATGGRARGLPMLAGYDNVLTLRTVDDALELRAGLVPGTRLVIVGAGFVGLEVAATARGLGVEVTVVEAMAAPLMNVLGARIGEWFAELHRRAGVSVLAGRTLERLEHARRRVHTLHLSDGTRLEADQIVVGIGTEPDLEWLAGTGLEARGGVRVDPLGRTSAPDIFAAGDVAATFDPEAGVHRPGSHWEAAARQATAAAKLMLGLEPGEPQAAGFWTDQYGLRIQYVGRAGAGDRLLIDGDMDVPSFTASFTRDGRVSAVLLVNRPRSLPAARASVERGNP